MYTVGFDSNFVQLVSFRTIKREAYSLGAASTILVQHIPPNNNCNATESAVGEMTDTNKQLVIKCVTFLG